MTVKRKDFQKAAVFIKEFLLKLSEDTECAELRDALNLALLHMQRYYRTLRLRSQSGDRNQNLQNSTNQNLSGSMRGRSPLTPFKDTPDKFVWKWFNIDSPKVPGSLPVEGDKNLITLPLIIQAAKQGDLDLVEQLIDKDNNCVEEIDNLGRTAVMYAVHYQNLDILQMLLNNGAEVNVTANDGSTAVHRACADGSPDALRFLILHQADVTIQDVYGRAPIHWAVTLPETKCLQQLLEQNVRISVRDKDGMTPSMWACRQDHIQHFELLSAVESQWGDDDSIETDNHGKTWMHWSVRRTEPLECLQTLLTEETAHLRDKDGKTVFLQAAEMGSLPAIKVILEIAGEECLQDQDENGMTALHLATIGGHGELVNFLLENGADDNCRDKMNAVPMDYAKSHQLHYCKLILSAHQRQKDRRNKHHNNSGDYADDNKENEILHSKPITPPHPPPPRAHPRRPVNSRGKRPPSAPPPGADDDVDEHGETVQSPNAERKKRIKDHSMDKPESPDMPPESSTDRPPVWRVTSVESSEDEGEGKQQKNLEKNNEDEPGQDENSIGGMDVSDIEGDEGEHPTSPQEHHSPVHQPTPPPRGQNKRQLPTPPPKQTKEPVRENEVVSPQPDQYIEGSEVSDGAPSPQPPAGSPHPPPRQNPHGPPQQLLQPAAPLSAGKRTIPPPQLMPLERTTEPTQSNKNQKKKKKKKKGGQSSEPVQELPPPRGYVAPVQAPNSAGSLGRPTMAPLGQLGHQGMVPMGPPMGPPMGHQQRNHTPPSRHSPEGQGQWLEEPPRPSAPLPPHSPREPQGMPQSPITGNGQGQKLQRMESEENLSAIETMSNDSSQKVVYEETMGMQSGMKAKYPAQNNHGPLARENGRVLMGQRQHMSNNGFKIQPNNGNMQRPRTPTHGPGIHPGGANGGPPHQGGHPMYGGGHNLPQPPHGAQGYPQPPSQQGQGNFPMPGSAGGKMGHGRGPPPLVLPHPPGGKPVPYS